ncbi:Sedoheptulose 1,7-bisphosphatase [Hypoxylon texense]
MTLCDIDGESGLLRTLSQPSQPAVGSTNRTHEAGNSGTCQCCQPNQHRRLSQPLQPSGADNFRAAELELQPLPPSANRQPPSTASANAVAQQPLHDHQIPPLPERPKPTVLGKRRITNPAKLAIRPISPTSSFAGSFSHSQSTPSLGGRSSSSSSGGSSGQTTPLPPPPLPSPKGDDVASQQQTTIVNDSQEKACEVCWRGYW